MMSKRKKKLFSVTVKQTVKHFYRVNASSAKEARRLFKENNVEFITKVKLFDKEINVEEI